MPRDPAWADWLQVLVPQQQKSEAGSNSKKRALEDVNADGASSSDTLKYYFPDLKVSAALGCQLCQLFASNFDIEGPHTRVEGNVKLLLGSGEPTRLRIEFLQKHAGLDCVPTTCQFRSLSQSR